MLIPRHYSNEQITELLDGELCELPVPPEWEAIRDAGGAIDLTDEQS